MPTGPAGGGAAPVRVMWLGHSSAVIDIDGVRLVTDPILTSRAGHLGRMVAPVAVPAAVDAVLISHLHSDHLHLPSLRLLRPAHVVAPPGAARILRRAGAPRVTSVREGDEVAVGAVTVRAVAAVHDGRRNPWSAPAPALGYVIAGSRRVYFAGDTGPIPDMRRTVGADIDAALLPIWGWGPRLGPGHLDPLTAAEALRLLHPRVAVPIHWGTYAPLWVSRRHSPAFLTRPAHDFARHAERLAPEVGVRVLRPGGAPLLLPGGPAGPVSPPRRT